MTSIILFSLSLFGSFLLSFFLSFFFSLLISFVSFFFFLPFFSFLPSLLSLQDKGEEGKTLISNLCPLMKGGRKDRQEQT